MTDLGPAILPFQEDVGHLMNTIRSINDHFRQTCAHVNVSPSIHALGPECFRRALKIVRHYDNFRSDVNPYEEHDCGTFKLDGGTTVRGRSNATTAICPGLRLIRLTRT